MRLRHRKSSAGYTAVEVLVAMTLFAIGAAGVIAMQRMAVVANAEARRVDVANGIARAWVERLRRDATLWTLPSVAAPTSTSNIANAHLLDQIITSTNGAGAGAWWFPDTAPATRTSANTADGKSPMFDTLGRDLAVDEAAHAFYCVEVRGDWAGANTVYPGNGGNPFREAIRAQVRVWWRRATPSATPTSGSSDCNATARTDASGANAAGLYNFVYAVTIVRKNPQP